jgi:hypothetical protein
VARAAAKLTGVRRVLVIGSQAILGTYDVHQLPPRVTLSDEADVVVVDDSGGGLADQIDAQIGMESSFDRTFGYYADGVELSTAKLPDGWEGRAIDQTAGYDEHGPIIARFIDVHDLVVSKMAAGRPQDREYVHALRDAGLVDGQVLVERAAILNDPTVPGPVRNRVGEWAQQIAECLTGT